ncbi:extracellular solute-binding protein [Paenibacillus sp. cl6col]|uniref:ABC transporter substrate-binding protein n=1 Tax=Paenibacillus sp. cl6col TaxID=1761878 RepID=UPI00088F7D8E|nr:ABC transporter substrate-binding protein [Paenibacillus sp. cl6col]SDE62828.1 extracellular solute-binding protein [Paenibacillus sp. cl6col]
MKRRLFPTLLASILCLASILTGCQKNEAPPFSKDKKAELTIAYTNENAFLKRYGNLFNQEYPNIRLSIVSTIPLVTKKLSVENWVQQNKFDIIYLPPDLVKEMAERNDLQDLDLWIKRDSFPLEEYIPQVIEYARSIGNGKLYGLPPTFYGQAIAFNKDLFEAYHIEYPQKGMTWEDLLRLSGKFPKDDGRGNTLFGLGTNDSSSFEFMLKVGFGQGLTMMQGNPPQAIVSSDSWKQIWQLTLPLLKSGLLINSSDLNTYMNTFLAGKQAMAVVTYEEYKQLAAQKKATFQWALAPFPVNPNQSGNNDTLLIDGLYAVSAQSTEKEAAWELVKFLNSRTIAKWNYRSLYGFSTLQNELSTNQEERERLSAMYALRQSYHPMGEVPVELVDKANAVIKSILDGGQSLEEALHQLQNEAQQIPK